MGKKRAHLNLDDDDQIDIGEFSKKDSGNKKTTIDRAQVQEVAEASGFPSRHPRKRRIKKRSPYVVQANLKARVGMKELLQELSYRLDKYDQETFELAILSLLEKEGFQDLIAQYKELTKG